MSKQRIDAMCQVVLYRVRHGMMSGQEATKVLSGIYEIIRRHGVIA